MPASSSRPERDFPSSAAQWLLREAKRLHRAATSDSISASLPVLRRLVAAQALLPYSLPALHRSRGVIQRKHILRMLALEAGHTSWEAYRDALPRLDRRDLELAVDVERSTSQLKLWFSTAEEASAYAKAQGGRVIPVRHQAVVVS